ncbi:MAG: hypothetical protein HY059_01185 [Proteobacteria bacterium]|nr:hypothetical protein [Pseudomonadota bacterium]
MALLGTGAVAMWWDIAPAHRAEFEDWHSHEHFPERMSIPGFRRGARWASSDGDGFFVMYELDAYETLVSDGYLKRLNAPTPWSTKMMPHHRNMVRSQCRVLESHGGALARHALTVRLSPAEDAARKLREHLGGLAKTVASRAGTTAGHLLETQTPKIAATAEQKIRGLADAAADWIFVACGYDRAALENLAGAELGDAALVAAGAKQGAIRGLYSLSHSNTSGDAG